MDFFSKFRTCLTSWSILLQKPFSSLRLSKKPIDGNACRSPILVTFYAFKPFAIAFYAYKCVSANNRVLVNRRTMRPTLCWPIHVHKLNLKLLHVIFFIYCFKFTVQNLGFNNVVPRCFDVKIKWLNIAPWIPRLASGFRNAGHEVALYAKTCCGIFYSLVILSQNSDFVR